MLEHLKNTETNATEDSYCLGSDAKSNFNSIDTTVIL